MKKTIYLLSVESVDLEANICSIDHEAFTTKLEAETKLTELLSDCFSTSEQTGYPDKLEELDENKHTIIYFYKDGELSKSYNNNHIKITLEELPLNGELYEMMDESDIVKYNTQQVLDFNGLIATQDEMDEIAKYIVDEEQYWEKLDSIFLNELSSMPVFQNIKAREVI